MLFIIISESSPNQTGYKSASKKKDNLKKDNFYGTLLVCMEQNFLT